MEYAAPEKHFREYRINKMVLMHFNNRGLDTIRVHCAIKKSESVCKNAEMKE